MSYFNKASELLQSFFKHIKSMIIYIIYSKIDNLYTTGVAL